MPKRKEEQSKSIESLRHNEYYGMQNVFDMLYNQSQNGEVFSDLMSIILKEDNILLAYRNIKANGGSKTPGTDKLNIDDIAKLSPDEVVNKVIYILSESKHGYRPKPVRRKEIPKPNGTMRPLGIPCIWDRLIQQCIKQVMEPICEAQFSNNSYGFRPIRSVENAIARTYRMLQMSGLHYVIEFDIKGFFDNVDHSKLIKQIWAMGIHDKKLIWIIKKILKAPIRMEDGTTVNPTKGTPQGGIISPLLANIVLNELDHWIESQWQYNPVTDKYIQEQTLKGNKKVITRSHGYRAMRDGTHLKEMWIVRYADDFRIFCKNQEDAERGKIAITKWLADRLKLQISEEKTRIVNAEKEYVEFLGFKVKLIWNRTKRKYVVESHISDKALKDKTDKLVEQTKKICENPGLSEEAKRITVYNSMVLGIQNYYRIATCVASDLNHAQQRTYRIMYNRLNTQTGNRLVRTGRKLNDLEKKRYGKSKALRFVKGSNEPIYPISYVQFRKPMAFSNTCCIYTPEGRKNIHDNLQIDTNLMFQLRSHKLYDESIEFHDNKISLYSAQLGKCYVTNRAFTSVEDIHCHHKRAKSNGGTDEYENLVLIGNDVHKLVHATNQEIINKYMDMLRLNSKQMQKINMLRNYLNLQEI